MRRTIISLALFAMMTAFGASKAHAVYLTYSYTGNNFIHFDNAPQFENPFGPQDRITGSFTIDCGALGGGGDCSSLPYSDYASAVTSWSFTAGPYTLDSTPTPPPPNEAQLAWLELSTDAAANIVYWDIYASTGTDWLDFDYDIWTYDYVDIYGIEYMDFVGLDDYRQIIDGQQLSASATVYNPGTWTVSQVSVPEPSTLANALVSLAALLLLLWRLRALPVRVYGRPPAPQLEP